MKLGRLAKAAILLIAPVLSMVAAAQSGGGNTGLNIPADVQFVTKQQPGIRKATAIVNGDVITESDIDQRLALILASQENAPPPEELQRVRAQVFRNLIDESLEMSEATRQDITIDDREVDAYFARFAQQQRHTPQSFSAYLRSLGSSDRSLKRQIRAEMSWQRLQRRNVEPFVTVGDDEVNAMIARLTASRGTAEYHVGEIFLGATPETAVQVQANAARIVQQIRAGANFQAYARQFSEASTAALGGDLGWVRAEQLPDEIANVVRQMPVGAISEPIANSGGYSIIVLADSRQLGMADPRDAVLSLMQVSIALAAGTTPAQAEQRAQQLGQATQSMGGCGHADATAHAIGAELVSNDQVRVRQLPAQLQQMLLGLSVGQATTPFGSAERISVLVLCGRDDPPAANLPSFDVIMTQLNDERVGRRAQRYLRDLRRDAVIDYR